MTVSYPTFWKFSESDKSLIAKQCNGVAAEIAKSHAGDHFLSGILNDNVLATSPCDPEDHIWAYLTFMN